MTDQICIYPKKDCRKCLGVEKPIGMQKCPAVQAKQLIAKNIRIVSFDKEFVEAGDNFFSEFNRYIDLMAKQEKTDSSIIPVYRKMILFENKFRMLIDQGYC